MEKFDNFQLYKTSPLLGGQMKLDMILDDKLGELYVKDFHLTPISSRVPYNKYSVDTLKNYSHQSNIKDFYKEIESSFYMDYVDPELIHEWPLIDDTRKNFDDTFFMGCRRANYSIYNKQFEFMLPLWLEYVPEDATIDFVINIYSMKEDGDGNWIRSGEEPVSVKTFSLNKNSEFGKYLFDYFDYVGITKGANEVMYVDLAKKYACITGLEVSTGNIVTKDVSSLVDNILYRERPLLESNYMITSQFSNNKLIPRQLINLCLCFNPEDLFTNVLKNMLIGHKFQISVDLKLNYIHDKARKSEWLSKKDMYTNHEFIGKSIYNESWYFDGQYVRGSTKKISDKINVLDYLQDNKCVDLIYSNKIVQKIPHWQIVDNSDYIFNVYEGFSGVYVDEKGIKFGAHTNSITPNIEIKEYKPELNNFGWANSIYLPIYNIDNFLLSSSWTSGVFSKMGKWVNGIRYSDNVSQKRLNVLLAYTDNKYDLDYDLSQIKLNNIEIEKYDDLIFIKNSLVDEKYDNEEYIIIYSFDKSKMTFASVREWLNKYTSEDSKPNILEDSKIKDVLNILKEYINSVVDQPIVTFSKSLKSLLTNSPSLSSKEIEYYKDNNSFSYLLRYDGYIKPCFISDPKNYIYTKKGYNSNMEIDKFNNKFNNSGYAPKFPSIDYYSLNNTNVDYNKIDNKLLHHHGEYAWFNYGEVMFLHPSIKYMCEIDIKTNIDDNIKNKLKEIYPKLTEYVDYIKSQYNITYNLVSTDWDGEGKIIKNKYTIEMNLK